MINSTICYIFRGDKVLLLYRNKKKNDANKNKWVGVGGKLEEKESPEDCVAREVFEETGLTPDSFTPRGVVTFVSNEWPTEQMFVFTSDSEGGELCECSEGHLEFKPISELYSLPMWEGDKIFLDLILRGSNFFFLKLSYEGEELKAAVLNGRALEV